MKTMKVSQLTTAITTSSEVVAEKRIGPCKLLAVAALNLMMKLMMTKT